MPPKQKMQTRIQRTHGDVVAEMCLLCMSRGDRLISERQKALITEHVFSRFSQVQALLPKRLCNRCSVKLNSLALAKARPLPPPLNFSAMADELGAGLPADRLASECHCGLCQRACWQPLRPMVDKPPSVYPVCTESGVEGRATTTAKATSVQVSSAPLCRECLAPVGARGRGQSHVCTKTKRLENLDKLLSPGSRQQLASDTIRQMTEASGSSTISLKNPHGKPTEVTATPKAAAARRRLFSNPQVVPSAAFQDLQVSEQMSGNSLKRTAQTLRAHGVPVEANLGRTLREASQRLKPFFELKTLEFEVQGEAQNVPKAVIVTSDPPGLVKAVTQARGVESCRYHLGMDGGGGFLKICLNIIANPRTPTKSPLAKRHVGSERFRDTGVKKLFVVGIVAGVPETYHNVKTLLEASKVTSISFSLATDMKLANILCGIMQHSSVHPCCWCEISARGYQIRDGALPRMRTLGRIRDQARLFAQSGGRKERAQEFYNCVEPPLFADLPDSVEILDLIPPPELHLMMGVTSKLYEEVLAKMRKDGEDAKRIEDWARAHNIVREEYRGGVMEGNKCRALLKQAVDLGKQLPDKYRVFAVALFRFSKVVTACFSKDLVQVDGKGYEELIYDFHQVYLACGISMTPKVHAVIMHVPQWCHRQGKGLGHASEQASESVHHDFKKKWENFKVREDNPRFGERLLSCVVQYNSSHI